MPPGVDSAITTFINAGLLGAAVILEAVVIGFLLRRLDGRDKIIENRDQVIAALQEKRVAENKENIQNFLTVGRDLVSGMAALKDSQASIMRYIENVSLPKKAV